MSDSNPPISFQGRIDDLLEHHVVPPELSKAMTEAGIGIKEQIERVTSRRRHDWSDAALDKAWARLEERKEEAPPEVVAASVTALPINSEIAQQESERSITLDDGTEIQKLALYKILPVLKAADQKAFIDFACHVAFGDALETSEGKILKNDVGYYPNSGGFSISVKNVVNACFMSDGCNDSEIVKKLTPDEVSMMNDPTESNYNLAVWQERKRNWIAEAARAARTASERRGVAQPLKIS